MTNLNPQTSSSLKGKRLLVTRAEEQGLETAKRLEALGAIPILMPLLAFHPAPDTSLVAKAVLQASEYDLVIFSSANAVRFFSQAFKEQGHVPAFSRTAAIGPGTARALEERGLAVDILPENYVGESLLDTILEEFRLKIPSGDRSPRVLLLRAAEARDVLPEGLRKAGWSVDVVPVYTTRNLTKTQQQAFIDIFHYHRPDVVLLASSSAATCFAELLKTTAEPLPEQLLIVSIGPITTRTSERLGLPVHLTAEVSTLEGMIHVLETRFLTESIPLSQNL